MRLRELPGVPHYRRRERDALRELVNDFANSFLLVPHGDFAYCCLQVYVMLVDGSVNPPAMDVLINPEDERSETSNQITTTQRRNWRRHNRP